MTQEPARARVRRAIARGLRFAAIYCLVGSALYLAAGLSEPHGVEYWAGLALLIFLYVFAGTTIGAVVGLLQPLARSLIGAMLVGSVAVLPFSLAVGAVFVEGPLSMLEHLVVASLTALVLGSCGGALVWYRRRRS